MLSKASADMCRCSIVVVCTADSAALHDASCYQCRTLGSNVLLVMQMHALILQYPRIVLAGVRLLIGVKQINEITAAWRCQEQLSAALI